MTSKTRKTVLFTLLAVALIILLSALYYLFLSDHARYTKSLSKADHLFLGEQYQSAKANYKDALGYKPDDPYLLLRISEADSLLGMQLTDSLFKSKLMLADSLFLAKEYERSRQVYVDAMQIKPDDPFLTDQLINVNTIIEEITLNRQISSADYHIVVGVFQNQENIDQMVEKMKQMGNNPQVIYRQRFDMHAVTHSSYTSIHDAYNQLWRVQETLYPYAWVLHYRIGS